MIYVYREYYHRVIVLLNCHSLPIFIEAILNDKQQAITPTNVDQVFGRRYQNVTKAFQSVSTKGMITTNNHLVAVGYSRETKMNWLWKIGKVSALSKKKTMELWRSDYPLWQNSFEWIILLWLPIWQKKIFGSAPDQRHSDAWPRNATILDRMFDCA